MSLSFAGVSHRYGATRVLDQVDLTAQRGEILCLLGPSGSGKSTLLRLAAGLEPLQDGRIVLDGALLAEPGNDPPPERRPVGLVFQDHVLFPHRTVAGNVAFGLAGLAPAQRRRRVAEYLRRVGLADFAGRYPHTLSGGQQQRVALARALAPQPEVMLLDEPFASIDATLRRELREDARLALKAAGVVTVVVTHDPDEALELGDAIAFLCDGRIVQCEAPERIWRAPADRTVAQAFGEAQSLAGEVRDGAVHTAFGALPTRLAEGARVDVLVRPGAVSLAGAGAGTVLDVRFLGDAYLVLLEAPGGEQLRARVADAAGLSPGQSAAVRFAPEGTFVYPCE